MDTRPVTPMQSHALPILSSPTGTEVTIEYSPVQKALDHEDFDFARITPINPIARQRFHEVVERMAADSTWKVHAKKFIQSSISADGKNMGCYRLNMNIESKSKRQGWLMGSDMRGQDKVDILLTPPSTKDHVQARHCRLVYDGEGGHLKLEARHTVIVDGCDEYGPQHSNSWRTVDKKMGISVGNLNYVIEFTEFSDTIQYGIQVERHLERSGRTAPVTPTPALTKHGHWRIYTARMGGTSSTVARGYNALTGKGVIVKTVQRSRNSHTRTDEEIRLLRKISNLSTDENCNVCKLADIIGEELFDHTRSDIDEVRIILTPMMTMTLAECFLSSSELLSAWKDCCHGLGFLHTNGITHRDVKPANIGIDREPFRAVLLDLGCASDKEKMDDHMVGTLQYLAPEIVSLKAWSREDLGATKPPPYDCGVDVWALAVTFWRQKESEPPWKEVSRESWAKWREKVQSGLLFYSTDDLFLNENILAASFWDSASRPKATTLYEKANERLHAPTRKRDRPHSWRTSGGDSEGRKKQ